MKDRLARIDHEPALNLVRLLAVTLVTVVHEHRPDLGFEEFQIGGGNWFCRRRMTHGHFGGVEADAEKHESDAAKGAKRRTAACVHSLTLVATQRCDDGAHGARLK